MRTLVIGDIHLPFEHPDYLQFCLDIYSSWNCNCVVFIGDVVDAHALSFWDTDPHGYSAEEEARVAAEHLIEWNQAFGVAKVCIGNHDERHYRKARKAGIPDRYLRTYNEIYSAPKWEWDFDHRIDGVLYTHGTGCSGKDAAINLAIQKRSSVAIGHTHSWGGVKYHSNDESRVFGMNVGCGVDSTKYAFAYGAHMPSRPTLGAGVVIEGKEAYFEPMGIHKGEPYHRNKSNGKKQ